MLLGTDLPLLHRSLGIAAYGEGWGLYAEQIADELGLYADEPLGGSAICRPLFIAPFALSSIPACTRWAGARPGRWPI